MNEDSFSRHLPHYFNAIQAMSEDTFLEEWHSVLAACNEVKLGLIESVATQRYGIGDFTKTYRERYPDQTTYPRPVKS